MHIPLTPPDFSEIINEVIDKAPKRFSELLSLRISPEPKGTYYHWDKLRHLKSLPNGISHREWWLAVKAARRAIYETLPHKSKDRTPFVYAETNSMRRLLHEIDLHGGGELRSNTQIASPSTRDTFLINSLIEEAITSSQLEGAATTRKVAKEMLRQNRPPRDRSEKMIVNNYLAMQFINEIGQEQLTPEIILELQRILTKDTLENMKAVGAWRENDEIYVADERDATVIHVPPSHKEIPARMQSICEFANDNDTTKFLHPVIRAVVLHFLLAYDHPFEDGNGRTARALFYWSMLQQRYWAMEFISISRILKNAPAQYTRSYLYTETDENDVTYFILHQLKVIVRAIEEFLEYLRQKSEERMELERLLHKSNALQIALNHRQLAALSRALKSPEATYTVESHRGAHNITYETARTDLIRLEEYGFLVKAKRGRAFMFTVATDLRQKLKDFRG